MKNSFLILILISILLAFTTSCNPEEKLPTTDNPNLTYFKLNGDLSERKLEASGLTWYKDNLIILPQFPHKWDNRLDGAIYYIPKSEIENFLNGNRDKALSTNKILFSAKGLDEIGKRRGSGYEAITFIDDTVFVSIESVSASKSTDYVVKGIMDFDKKLITLDANSKIEIKSQTNINNMGEETILEFNNHIYTIHEANGENVNKAPFASQISTNLKNVEKIPFPNVDYRITDATKVDSTGKFFATNYFYPGEFDDLKPNLTDKEKNYAIEQILEFKILNNKIERTEKAPFILSKGESKKGRNWEGIVKFNNGFILITDMFPETILAYYKLN